MTPNEIAIKVLEKAIDQLSPKPSLTKGFVPPEDFEVTDDVYDGIMTAIDVSVYYFSEWKKKGKAPW